MLRDAGERPLHTLPCDLLMRAIAWSIKVEVELRLFRASDVAYGVGIIGLSVRGPAMSVPMEVHPRFGVVAPVR